MGAQPRCLSHQTRPRRPLYMDETERALGRIVTGRVDADLRSAFWRLDGLSMTPADAGYFAGVTRRACRCRCRSAARARRPGPAARRGCARAGSCSSRSSLPTFSPSSSSRTSICPASAPTNRLPLPGRKQVAGVERHAGRRDRRHPVFDRLLHAGLVRALVDLARRRSRCRSRSPASRSSCRLAEC